MFSIYSSAFNLIKNQFDYEKAIANFCGFADEVVIAVNTSVDCTFERLAQLQKSYDNLVLIETSFSYQNPAFDGLIKNAALQATTEPLKVLLDMDERINPANKLVWRQYGTDFLLDKRYGALFIPVIDLFKDINHYKSIGSKWYMHKEGLKRGVVNFAKKENGKIDIERSDTCELINNNGDLVNTAQISSEPDNTKLLRFNWNTLPYVIHLGYCNLNKRLNITNPFWKGVWENRAGHEVKNIAATEDDFKDTPYMPHGLDLSFLS